MLESGVWVQSWHSAVEPQNIYLATGLKFIDDKIDFNLPFMNY